MKLTFLTPHQAKEMFREPDSYARKLPLSNLKMICPNNPTIEGYQEIFLSSFEPFSPQEQDQIKEDSTKHLKDLDLEINLIKTNRAHSLDITQTRNNSILVTNGRLGVSTLVHEVYHILSRQNPDLTSNLAKIWGFKKIQSQIISHPNFLLNPDAEECNYSIEVKKNNSKDLITVCPFVQRGLLTGLKVVDQEIYLKETETNYSKLIPNTTYTAHPEEICAEHFALSVLGTCLFRKETFNQDVISSYKSQIKKELNLKLSF